MEMRPNVVKERVESGNVSVGLRNGFFHSKALIEVAGHLGMDWVRMEYEPRGPAPADTGILEDYARAAEVSGTEVMLRFHRDVDLNAVRNAVKAGIRNIQITHVETAEHIDRILEATMYARDGRHASRGVAGSRSNQFGHAGMSQESLDEEDDNLFIGIMIESGRAIENLDEIFSVPELGHAMLGLVDLAHSLGHIDETDHPDVIEAKKTFVSKVEEYDVPVYVDLHDDVEAQQAIENGLSHGQDKVGVEHRNVRLLGISRPITDIQTAVNERYDALVAAGHIEDNRDA